MLSSAPLVLFVVYYEGEKSMFILHATFSLLVTALRVLARQDLLLQYTNFYTPVWHSSQK